MRHAVLVLAFAALTLAAKSQITILPQAGIDNPISKIKYNNLSYFAPLNQLQPQLGVRADYKFKNGFGPFVGLATSRSSVNYNFNDPENGMTAYRASLGKTQLQLRAGLQYSTKPILFNRKSSERASKTSSSEKTSSHYSTSCSHSSSSCSHYSSSCCQKKSSFAEKAKSQNQSWAVRVEPSAGFGFVPSNKPDLVTKTSAGQTSYVYNAGNFRTALLTGVGFEFSKNRSRLFTLSVNYFKGLGSKETTFTTQSATKTTTTSLSSKLSGWNASIGIPIGLTKRSTAKNTKQENKKYDCGQYRIERKYRCGKVI